MSNVVPFNFGDISVRVVMQGGEPWWVANDVAQALEYRMASDMTRHLDDEEADTHNLRIRSESGVEQERSFKIINESGLYSAILKSRKPSAKRFKKWVTGEVLPTIRKTGSFGSVAPVNLSDASALRGLLLGYTEQVLKLEHKITEDQPKVEFYDNVAVAVGTQSVQDVAKEFGMGSTKFYKLLRDQKILMGHPNQNVPYQKHMDAGHFEVVVGEWKVQETGEVKLKPRSFVTAKGLIYLERRLNKLGHFRNGE